MSKTENKYLADIAEIKPIVTTATSMMLRYTNLTALLGNKLSPIETSLVEDYQDNFRKALASLNLKQKEYETSVGQWLATKNSLEQSLATKKTKYINSCLLKYLNDHERARIENEITATEIQNLANNYATQNKSPITNIQAKKLLGPEISRKVDIEIDKLKDQLAKDESKLDEINLAWGVIEKEERKKMAASHAKIVANARSQIKPNIEERAHAYRVQSETVDYYCQALQDTMDAEINFSLPFQESTILLANTNELLIKAKAPLNNSSSNKNDTLPSTLDLLPYETLAGKLAQLQENHKELFKIIFLSQVQKENEIKKLKDAYFLKMLDAASKDTEATAKKESRRELLKDNTIPKLNEQISETHKKLFKEKLERVKNRINDSKKRLLAVKLEKDWNKIHKRIESLALEGEKPPKDENENKLYELIKEYQIDKENQIAAFAQNNMTFQSTLLETAKAYDTLQRTLEPHGIKLDTAPAKASSPPQDLATTLKSKIDQYDIEYASDAPLTQTPDVSHLKVRELLGEAGEKILYDGINQHKPPSKNARELLIDKLMAVLADPNKDFKVTSPDTRTTNPTGNTISLERFLDKDGLDLYKKAIKEEMNSTQFRDAVFLKSATYYPGAKWKERMILWVAGPSASGKTHATKDVIKMISKNASIMEQLPNNTEGNHVISIDGSIEREVCQMRQLVLQLALKKGFPGIDGLDDYAKMKLKSKVQKAALTKPDLHIVIPKTFTDLRTKFEIPTFDTLENTKQIFSEVVGFAGEDEDFKRRVKLMGDSRAWSQKFDDDHTKDRKLVMNNRDLDCESKKYNPVHFDRGKSGSGSGRDKYLKNTKKDRTYIAITNDLLFVKPIQFADLSHDLVEFSATDRGPAIKITARDLAKWKTYKNNGYKMDGLASGLTNPEDWLKELKKSIGISSSLLEVTQREGSVKSKLRIGMFAVRAKIKLQAKKAAAASKNILYAKTTAKGLGNYIKASTNLGEIGRIFDDPKPEEVSPQLQEWARGLYQKYRLVDSTQKKIPNNLFKKRNAADRLSTATLQMPYNTGFLAAGCTISTTDTLPTEDYLLFLPTDNHAAYLRYTNPDQPNENFLFYVNKARNELKRISLTSKELASFDQELKPEITRALNAEDLKRITTLTKHEHKPEHHQIDPALVYSVQQPSLINRALKQASKKEHNLQLAPWIKKMLPAGFDKLCTNLLMDLYNKANEITFTEEGELQPWIKEAIELPAKDSKGGEIESLKLTTLFQKNKKADVERMLAGAVITSLREALLKTLPFAENTPERKALENFFLFLDQIHSHKRMSLSYLENRLSEDSRMRSQNPDMEMTISSLRRTFNNLTLSMCKDYFMDIEMDIGPFMRQTLTLLDKLRQERDDFGQEKHIRNETFSSQIELRGTTKPKKSNTLFQDPAPKAGFSSETTEAIPANALQKHVLTLTQKNATMQVTLEERIATGSETNPISEITRLNGDLDTAGTLASEAFHFKDLNSAEPLNLFADMAEAKKFFTKAIKHMREVYGAISKDNLAATINERFDDTVLTPTQLAILTDRLFKAYKNTTEQLDPYDDTERSEKPYERKNHFPSDAFIRLAKHHVESYAQLCNQVKPQIVIHTACWDPHYIEAVRLWCAINDYPEPEYDHDHEQGWELQPLTEEKVNAFKSFYEQRHQPLDKLAVNQTAANKPPLTTPAKQPMGHSLRS